VAPPRASERPWSLSFISVTVNPPLQKYTYNITLYTHILKSASHSCVHGRATDRVGVKVMLSLPTSSRHKKMRRQSCGYCLDVHETEAFSQPRTLVAVTQENITRTHWIGVRVSPKGRSGRFGEGKSSYIVMSENHYLCFNHGDRKSLQFSWCSWDN